MDPIASAKPSGLSIRSAARRSKSKFAAPFLWIRKGSGCMPDLPATPPLELQHGRHGQADGNATTLRQIGSRALVSVIARKGKAEPLVSAAKQAFGVTLPDRPRLERGQTVSFLWSGHQHWLAVADRPDLLSQLRANLGAFASLSDQSDSRVILELSGPAARQTL